MWLIPDRMNLLAPRLSFCCSFPSGPENYGARFCFGIGPILIVGAENLLEIEMTLRNSLFVKLSRLTS